MYACQACHPEEMIAPQDDIARDDIFTINITAS